MLIHIVGDIFQSDASVLVCPVNTAGIVKGGIAEEFKNRYPSVFRTYTEVCDNQLLEIGKLMLLPLDEKRSVLLFPVKTGFYEKSKLEYIKAGLEKFCKTYERKNIKSIAFPLLGYEDGLDKEKILNIMDHYIEPLHVIAVVYVRHIPANLQRMEEKPTCNILS